MPDTHILLLLEEKGILTLDELTEKIKQLQVAKQAHAE